MPEILLKPAWNMWLRWCVTFLSRLFFFFTLCPTKEGNSFEAWFLVVVLELEQLNVWKVLTLKQCIFVWVCISPLSDVFFYVSRYVKKKKKKKSTHVRL